MKQKIAYGCLSAMLCSMS